MKPLTCVLHVLFLFPDEVPCPNWVRRSRRSTPIRSRQRKRRRRRLGLSTKSLKRRTRGSWRITRRWHLPPDTSKCSSAVSHSRVSRISHFSLIDSLFAESSMWLCKFKWKVTSGVLKHLQHYHCNPFRIHWPYTAVVGICFPFIITTRCHLFTFHFSHHIWKVTTWWVTRVVLEATTQTIRLAGLNMTSPFSLVLLSPLKYKCFD